MIRGYAFAQGTVWQPGPTKLIEETSPDGAEWRRAEEVGEMKIDASGHLLNPALVPSIDEVDAKAKEWVKAAGKLAGQGGGRQAHEVEDMSDFYRTEDELNATILTADAENIAKEVRNEIQFVIQSYMKHALGCDEIGPVSGQCKKTMGIAVTALDSLSTLYLAGLKEEFNEIAEWISNKLKIVSYGRQSVFETTIRAVGGLASAHSLSGHEGLKRRMTEFADDLFPAFNTPSGVPRGTIDLKNPNSTDYLPWLSGVTTLADAGSLGLEFRYVTQVSGDPRYENAINRIEHALLQARGGQDGNGISRGLLGSNIGSVDQLTLSTSGFVSFGGASDSYYEYLLKQYLQTGKKDEYLAKEWIRAVDQMIEKLVRQAPSGDLYVASLMSVDALSKGHSRFSSFPIQPTMEHLTCFVPGMLELGYNTLPNPNKTWHDVAAALTETCYKMYRMSRSGLAPEVARFDGPRMGVSNRNYFLRPEVAESIFYMWYFTKDDKYRKMSYDIFKAIKKLKTPYGYAETTNVEDDPPPLHDAMQSFFVSETLMYLYLPFAPEGTIDLSKQVFTTEGHPLPRTPGNTSPELVPWTPAQKNKLAAYADGEHAGSARILGEIGW